MSAESGLPRTPEQFYFFYDDQQVWHDLDYLRNVLVGVFQVAEAMTESNCSLVGNGSSSVVG